MLELWLIRHGETDWNREGRTQGHSSNGLSALGLEQARRLAVRLEEQAFDLVYASDLERAEATARLALPGREMILDRRLRELSGGVLEGRLRGDFTEAERATYERAYRDMSVKRAAGGESVAELLARVAAWLGSLPQDGRAIAFCHGGVIRAALHLLLGTPWPELMSAALPNTSVTKVVVGKVAVGEESRLLELAGSAHLGGLGG